VHSVAECSAALQAMAVRLMPVRAVGPRTRRNCGNSLVSRLARSGARTKTSPRKHSDWGAL